MKDIFVPKKAQPPLKIGGGWVSLGKEPLF